MTRPKGGLGRGLGALIPGPEDAELGSTGSVEIPVEAIVPNPWQPRQAMSEESLRELAASIREHGLIQPLIITRAPTDDDHPAVRYRLIAGERRWQAAQMAGLTVVPAIIKDVTPQEMLELALVENLQRADLNPLEEASAYRQLITEFGLTQEQVAERVGKSRAAVANAVRLLRLPDVVKARLSRNDISEGHARALLTLDDEGLQLKALEAILKRGLSVRQTEDLVRDLMASPAASDASLSAATALSPEERALEDHFRRILGTKVSLSRGKEGGGRLVIQFYSDEELQNIYEILTRGSGA
jgi:ParB family transcriptional regulator, chromosome partitioning protein